MSSKQVGRCGACGGPVTVPALWYGVGTPVATCERCGRHAMARGPVLPMEPLRERGGR